MDENEKETEVIENVDENEKENVDLKAENEMLKSKLAEAEKIIQELQAEINRLTMELTDYREIAEQKIRDAAWEKQVARLPEKYRTEEVRNLYENDKEGYIDLLASIASTFFGHELESDAEGNINHMPVERTNRIAELGYELITK